MVIISIYPEYLQNPTFIIMRAQKNMSTMFILFKTRLNFTQGNVSLG